MTEESIELLKIGWEKRVDGCWAINSMKPLKLTPELSHEPDFFRIQDRLEIINAGPLSDITSSAGTTNYLLKQSIVPVVTYVEGENVIRSIGTGFIISCSGLVVTAWHVSRPSRQRLRQYTKNW